MHEVAKLKGQLPRARSLMFVVRALRVFVVKFYIFNKSRAFFPNNGYFARRLQMHCHS
jgi:hypothetical protein